MLNQLKIKGRDFKLPLYLPDATRAVVRSTDMEDVKRVGIEAVMVNAYHLMHNPGMSVLKKFGGLKNFMGWQGLLASDSGGFQILSMIYMNKSLGEVRDEGVVFKRQNKKYKLTPEKSIAIQFNIGSDIMICLDDCPKGSASKEEIAGSVQRTIAWAGRCKAEYERQLASRKISQENAPLLFAVVQGGEHKDLREECAKGLLALDFSAYAFGGWPMGEDGKFNFDIVRYTASLIPEHFPKFALGIGKPQEIVEGFKMGYHIFDCVLPTRDGRHKRLYVFKKDPKEIDFQKEEKIYDYFRIGEEKYVRDKRPISEFCDCHTCQHYSRAYLHHLFKIEDTAAYRLATIHNLRMYSMVIDLLRETIK
ncbi:MAG: tRNA guanosine(34) transglycosylase Tgt [Patescibacteria group bacterium]|nr:tRNA guanosine(34) transglycosylase Tgt [Patescibacteria group bacterium]